MAFHAARRSDVGKQRNLTFTLNCTLNPSQNTILTYLDLDFSLWIDQGDSNSN